MKQLSSMIVIAMLLVGCTMSDMDREVNFSDLFYRGGIAYALPAGSNIPEEEPFTGWALDVHENGQVRLSGRFVNGKPEGRWDLWRDDQTLRATVTVSADAFVSEKEACSLLVNGEGEICLDNFVGLVRHEYSEWYPGGQIAREIQYKDIKPEASPADGAESGEVSQGTSNVDHVRKGLAREWHDNGRLSREAPYKDDVLDGRVREWHANGRLAWDVTYLNGKREGLARGWHENGQLYQEATYNDDKLEGLVRDWHANGQLWWEVPYADGKRQGLARGWHENGQLYQEAPYVDNKLEGLVRDWHENGQLWWEVPYADGERQGLARGWHENGQLYLEETYEEGQREGLSRGWDENGQLSWDGVFRDDSMVDEG